MNDDIENLEEQTKILFKIGNKLEQRISKLEKVLASHAKCIGEMRDKKDDLKDMPEEVLVKTWEEKDEWIKIVPRSELPYVWYYRQETWTKRKQKKYNS